MNRIRRFYHSVGCVLARNIFARQDKTLIKQDPADKFCEERGLSRTIWIPARSLTQSVTGSRRRRCHLVSYSPLTIVTLAEHATFRFIGETIGQGRGLRDTTLYADALREGRRVVRQTSEGGIKTRISVTEEDQLARYRDRCLALARSIETNGIIDLSTTDGRGLLEADGLDGNAVVTIDDEGRILHFTRGRHRLAIAGLLDLDVPVYVHSVSGKFLQRFLTNRLAPTSGQLIRALGAAIASAGANTRRGAPIERPPSRAGQVGTATPVL